MNDKLDIDGAVEAWLAESGPPLSDQMLGQAIDRAFDTPQRRRWWPTKWFPTRTGATRSTVRLEDRSRGGSAHMFAAVSVTAVSVILAIGGSVALFGGALAPAQEAATVPAAAASTQPVPEPEALNGAGVRVTGTGGGHILEMGEISGDELRDRVATTMYLSTTDPRVMGEDRFVHNIDAYRGDLGPEWGTYRLENDGGAWEGTLDGYFAGPMTHLSGWLTGEGDYEGLTYYMEYVLDNYSFGVEINGIIFAGDPPADPPAVEPWELASAATLD